MSTTNCRRPAWWVVAAALTTTIACGGDEIRLHGIVRGADGRPLAGELVMAPLTGDGPFETDDQGHYVASFELSPHEYRFLELVWNRARLRARSAPGSNDVEVPDLQAWTGDPSLTQDGDSRTLRWSPAEIPGRALEYTVVSDDGAITWSAGTDTSLTFDTRAAQDFASQLEVVAGSPPDSPATFYVETASLAVELGAQLAPGSRGAPCELTPPPSAAAACSLTDGPSGRESENLDRAVIDLGTERMVEAVSIIDLRILGMGIEGTNGVSIALSTDGTSYTQIGFYSLGEAFLGAEAIVLDQAQAARFVKLTRVWYASNQPMTFTVREVGVYP